jgi:hypothetical protein
VRKKARHLRLVKETLRGLESLGLAPLQTYETACASFLCFTSAAKGSCSYGMCEEAGLGLDVRCQPAPDPTGGV